MKMPEPGLYRTQKPYPGRESDIPEGVLVYLGTPADGSMPFVVRPTSNRHNRWYWREPTVPVRALSWCETLMPLPAEGFYTLPQELRFESGGRWLENAIVQLGYNGEGRGILFVAEQHEGSDDNALRFSDRGRSIDDALLKRLRWAPILPVKQDEPVDVEVDA
ncbi:MAG: hypothetical protein IT373_14690 [Polyangiaceae bacterium]|nr:hypothetical protein [Polyangiaceae bacterium]